MICRQRRKEREAKTERGGRRQAKKRVTHRRRDEKTKTE